MIEIASKYDPSGVEDKWYDCRQAHEADGCDAMPEYHDWVDKLRDRDAYSVHEVLNKLPWLKDIK